MLLLAIAVAAISAAGAFWLPADSVNILAPWWWPLGLVAVLLAAWILRNRHGILAGIAIAAMAFQGWSLFYPAILAAPSSAPGSARPLKLVSYNMFKFNRQLAQDSEWLLEQDADIIVLLEAHSMLGEKGAALRAAYPTVVDCSPRFTCSTIVLSRFPVTAKDQLAGIGDAENRGAVSALVLTLDVKGTPLTVFAVHQERPWPFGQQARWAPTLRWASAETEGAAIMAGDFNSVPWAHSQQALAGAGHFSLASRGVVSWPAENSALMRLPLDQIWVKGMAAKAVTGPKRGSDHLPLITQLWLPDK